MRVKREKKTRSGSLLRAREVEVVTRCRKREKKTTSGSLLRAREVEVVTRCRKREKKTTSGSLLRAWEVGWRHVVENVKKRPPPARFCVRGRWLNVKKIL